MRGMNVSQMPAQIPTDDGTLNPFIDNDEAQLKLGSQVRKEALQKSEQDKNAAQAAEATAGTAEKNATAQFYQQNPSAGAPGVPAETAAIASYLRDNPGKTPADYPGYKAGQEAKVKQPYELQLKQQEVVSTQAIQGMVKPVYAFWPGWLKSIDESDRCNRKRGARTWMVPVTEKEVGDDNFPTHQSSRYQ